MAHRAFRRQLRPSRTAAAVWSVLVFLLLLTNGRAIGSGDTRATEYVAASLVHEHDFDLDEYPQVEQPFAREVDGRRLSIYPVWSAVLAAPVFAALGTEFALDEVGTALAGKVSAALFSALAVGFFYLGVARRHFLPEASAATFVFALGTSVVSASQALWQHPAAVLALCVALWMLRLAEDDARWAGRAGLPLAALVAARHADVAIFAVLVGAVAVRWPRRLLALVAWGAPLAVFVVGYQWLHFGSPLAHGFSGSLASRFSEPWLTGLFGLLMSPAKGLFVFTPVTVVALVGLVRVYRDEDRFWPLAYGLAAVAHLVFMSRWTEWHGGDSWGPRMMTDALPLLFVFLPDGLKSAGHWGTTLAAVSIAVQQLGAFTYDYRWERLYFRGEPTARREALWDVVDSPIAFQVRERTVILAAPGIADGHAYERRHPIVPGGPRGSTITFLRGEIVVDGAPRTLEAVHLQRRARVDDVFAHLEGNWAAVFARVTAAGRRTPLQLRVDGTGRGVLYVGETHFWRRRPEWTEYRMNGRFTIRHPYDYPESAGSDLLITTGRGGGSASIERIELTPP